MEADEDTVSAEVSGVYAETVIGEICGNEIELNKLKHRRNE